MVPAVLRAHLLGKLSTSGTSLSDSTAANSAQARAASTRAADRHDRKEPTTREYTYRCQAMHSTKMPLENASCTCSIKLNVALKQRIFS